MPSAILDPTGRKRSRKAVTLAPRQASLSGLTVGLLENGKHNAGLFLQEVGRLLEERHGAKGLVLRRKASIVLPASDEIMDELARQCQVVIAGVGD
jgi:hypothetical protein